MRDKYEEIKCRYIELTNPYTKEKVNKLTGFSIFTFIKGMSKVDQIKEIGYGSDKKHGNFPYGVNGACFYDKKNKTYYFVIREPFNCMNILKNFKDDLVKTIVSSRDELITLIQLEEMDYDYVKIMLYGAHLIDELLTEYDNYSDYEIIVDEGNKTFGYTFYGLTKKGDKEKTTKTMNDVSYKKVKKYYEDNKEYILPIFDTRYMDTNYARKIVRSINYIKKYGSIDITYSKYCVLRDLYSDVTMYRVAKKLPYLKIKQNDRVVLFNSSTREIDCRYVYLGEFIISETYLFQYDSDLDIIVGVNDYYSNHLLEEDVSGLTEVSDINQIEDPELRFNGLFAYVKEDKDTLILNPHHQANDEGYIKVSIPSLFEYALKNRKISFIVFPEITNNIKEYVVINWTFIVNTYLEYKVLPKKNSRNLFASLNKEEIASFSKESYDALNFYINNDLSIKESAKQYNLDEEAFSDLVYDAADNLKSIVMARLFSSHNNSKQESNKNIKKE